MRPTFDRRLWILLFFILLQCIQTTNQQNITTALQQQLRQQVPAQKPDVSTTQNDQIHYRSSHRPGDTKPTTSGRKSTSSAGKNSLHSCAKCLRGELRPRHQESHLQILARRQNLKTQIRSLPPLLPISSLNKTAAMIAQMLSSSINPSKSLNSDNSSVIRTTTTANRLQQESLQSYLDEQGPSSEDAAQESLEQQQKEHSRRFKREATKSLDLSLTSSGVLSSEEFTIDDNNKLLSSSDIRKSDIRINKTKISSPASSADSSSSSSSSPSSSAAETLLSSLSPLKTPSDASLLASAPALSDTALLYSQPYLSQESLSSSIEDERTSSSRSRSSSSSSSSSSRSRGSSSRLSSSILPLVTPLQMDVANKSHSDSRVKQKSVRAVKKKEPIIIIDDAEEFDSGGGDSGSVIGSRGSDLSGLGVGNDDETEYYSNSKPVAMPLRPIIRGPYDDEHDEEMSVVYAEQHTEVRLVCEVDLDIALSSWYKNGLSVHAIERSSRITDYRFVKEINGALTITNVMLEDDGKWQCEAENANAYIENARPVKLVVLDRPKPPYLLIDSRRLDAGNIFVPVKENSELNLACISEGGNPKPTLTWEVLLSPGVDRHAQKVAAEVLELEEIKKDKEKLPYKMNSGAKSEARLPAVYRAHHNARILCVMEHPTLKIRQNASLLLDVQYTPSFAISRTPGFGYPLREGIEVSLKCDVDSNPPSTPRWQKDDGDTPVPQTGDGFLNFTSIRREHSGWYKCTSRHLNFQYSSIGYYLSVRYDSVDVTSEPDDQDVSVAASHNPNKGQLEVQLGGAVTLQCPQGSLGCWSHLDPVTARLHGLGHGLSTPTGQFSLKDVVYQDAGTYKCIGQSPTNKKKLEVLQTVGVLVKGMPTVTARNATPVAYPGSPLHLAVEFCANPPAHAARWLHGDRVFTPGNQYGSTVLAYGVTDLPTPYCKEARLTYVSMHERVPRTFYFIVSSPAGVAEAVFKVNFTMRYRTMSNSVDDEEEELSEPEEIQFPVFGSGTVRQYNCQSLFIVSNQMFLLFVLHAVFV